MESPDPPDDMEDPVTPPGGHIACELLWALADQVGCGLAKLICSALENVPIAGEVISCDVAVPLACGLSSAAADAAAEACAK
ncbi:Hypothetical protein A7982_06609 [Minicystis rosea]|nr:Hypothetical protein A7982_06609 [Minicystis rosea]